jgi:hypothetical protein
MWRSWLDALETSVQAETKAEALRRAYGPDAETQCRQMRRALVGNRREAAVLKDVERALRWI